MIKSDNSRWLKAQGGESRCWESNAEKIISVEYRENKRRYWDKTINKLINIKEIKNKRILDFGCGPSGIAMYLDKNYHLVCIDPLMKVYLRMFKFLKKYDAEYINIKIENYNPKNKFDFIFGFNSVDHVESINITLKNLKRLLEKKGYLIITLNCHNYSVIQFFLKKFSFILDKPHPHQYTAKQYRQMIEKAGFIVEKIINVDDETHWINEKTKNSKKTKNFKNLFSPGSLFFSLLEIFGIKRYGQENDKTAYSHLAFICKKNNCEIRK